MTLDGKRIVVLGGSSGIGLATARRRRRRAVDRCGRLRRRIAWFWFGGLVLLLFFRWKARFRSSLSVIVGVIMTARQGWLRCQTQTTCAVPGAL